MAWHCLLHTMTVPGSDGYSTKRSCRGRCQYSESSKKYKASGSIVKNLHFLATESDLVSLNNFWTLKRLVGQQSSLDFLKNHFHEGQTGVCMSGYSSILATQLFPRAVRDILYIWIPRSVFENLHQAGYGMQDISQNVIIYNPAARAV